MPGLVKTSISGSLPWYFHWAFQTLAFFRGITVEDCSEWMIASLVDPETKTGAWFKTQDLERIKPYEGIDETARTVVWKHIEERTNV